MALQHAQLRLGREFTREEFMEGSVGKHMVSEDFDFDVTVSKLNFTYRNPKNTHSKTRTKSDNFGVRNSNVLHFTKKKTCPLFSSPRLIMTFPLPGGISTQVACWSKLLKILTRVISFSGHSMTLTRVTF